MRDRVCPALGLRVLKDDDDGDDSQKDSTTSSIPSPAAAHILSCGAAPFSKSRSATSRLPMLAAHCSGVDPQLVSALMSAPAATSTLASRRSFFSAAQCNGVLSYSPLALTSAGSA